MAAADSPPGWCRSAVSARRATATPTTAAASGSTAGGGHRAGRGERRPPRPRRDCHMGGGPSIGADGPPMVAPPRRGFLIAYLCGVLWYAGNCYWVRDAMLHYGDMPLGAPTLLLLGFSLVLGLYLGLFGLGLALVQRATGSTKLALAFAPILWAALELAAARITSVPWDQLGYSQVDNALVSQLAPWTGVYGISFLLVAVNALLAGGLVLGRSSGRRLWGIAGLVLLVGGTAGIFVARSEERRVGKEGRSRWSPYH